jgi:HK97 family phage portal protein
LAWFPWPKRKNAGTTVIMTSADLAKALASGEPSITGETVNATTAQRVNAVFACVRVLSESIACTPLHLYRRDGKNRNRATDHPLYSLLHDAPNGFQTPFEWLEQMMWWLLLRGRAVYLKNVVRGEVRELLPLHPDAVAIEQDDRYRLTYKVSAGPFKGEYAREDVVHVKGLGDDFRGQSVIEHARNTVGMSLALDRHGAKLFAKGARPSGILSTDETLQEDAIDALREHFSENQGGIAVLDQGLKFFPITMTSVDAQYLESCKFQVRGVCRIFRVQPHKIMDLDNATFSNIEHQSIEFETDSAMPWQRRIEQALNRDLVPPERRREYYAEFLSDSWMRGDSKARSAFTQSAIQNGWMNRNEVRELHNLNPVDGLDEFLEPQNRAPAGERDAEGDGKPNGDGNANPAA